MTLDFAGSARRLDKAPRFANNLVANGFVGVLPRTRRSWLKLVLDLEGYKAALELLTEAATNDGQLRGEAIARYNDDYEGAASIQDVLHVLEHDGYLEPSGNGHRFVSALLEDWWRARHGQHFVPIAEREPAKETS